MTLSEMSVNDLIAFVCLEVYECFTGNSYDQEAARAALLNSQVYHALWFAQAWEFLEGKLPLWRACKVAGGWCATHEGMGHGQATGLRVENALIGPYPTKYHALGAAVLMAAGKVVP